MYQRASKKIAFSVTVDGGRTQCSQWYPQDRFWLPEGQFQRSELYPRLWVKVRALGTAVPVSGLKADQGALSPGLQVRTPVVQVCNPACRNASSPQGHRNLRHTFSQRRAKKLCISIYHYNTEFQWPSRYIHSRKVFFFLIETLGRKKKKTMNQIRLAHY